MVLNSLLKEVSIRMVLRKLSRAVHRVLGLHHKIVKRDMRALHAAGLVTIDEAKSLARFLATVMKKSSSVVPPKK